MIQLNLLPDVKKEFLKAQRTKNTVISISVLVTVGSLGLALLLAGIVYLVQPGLIALRQSDVDKKTEELRAVPDIGKYLTIQNQLESLPGLHDDKVVYSRLLDYLKVLNPAPPNNIRLSSLQVDEENKTIFFTGVTGGFEAFNVFQDTLSNAQIVYKAEDGSEVKEKMFEDNGIVIQNQTLADNQGKQELSFSLEATYREQIFSPLVIDPKLEVPNITTTQSVTGTPGRASAPLFDENANQQNQGGQ